MRLGTACAPPRVLRARSHPVSVPFLPLLALALLGVGAGGFAAQPSSSSPNVVGAWNPREDLDPSRGLEHRDLRERGLHDGREAGHRLVGIVRDRSGSPVPRAQVTLAWGDDPMLRPGGAERELARDAGRARVRSDPSGSFAFDVGSLPRTSGRLRVTRAGYRDVEVEVSWLGETPRVGVILDEKGSAAPAGLVYLTLRGSVRDSRGRPVPGADLQARDPEGGDFAARVRADSDGRYQLSLWGAPSTAALRVEKESFVTVEALSMLGAPGQGGPLVQYGSYDFVLRRPGD